MNGLTGRHLGCAYSCSKSAVEALSEVLSIEAERFIRCMVLEFGWFPGTEIWAGKSIYKESEFDIYKNIDDFYEHKILCKNELKGAVCQIIKEVENEVLPLRLMLGYDSQERAKAKIDILKRDLAHSKKSVNKYSKKIQNRFLENIFSIKGDLLSKERKKVITFFWMKFKFKVK